MSDHLPVVMSMALPQPCIDKGTSNVNKVDFQRLRWDRADLSGFYNASYHFLSAVSVPFALCNGADYVDHKDAQGHIDAFYSNIVNALSCAAAYTVPLAKASFFKFWWDEECQVLKEESVSKYRTWVALGRPREGPVASAMRKARCEYKLLLKHKRYQAHSCFSNELHDSSGFMRLLPPIL